jgi:hypothetical protein
VETRSLAAETTPDNRLVAGCKRLVNSADMRRTSCETLFAGQSGGLRAIAQKEKEFTFFRSHEDAVFEMESDPAAVEGIVLQSCFSCDEPAGIHSFLSYSHERFGPYEVSPPKLIASAPALETAMQIQWIKRHGSETPGPVCIPRSVATNAFITEA